MNSKQSMALQPLTGHWLIVSDLDGTLLDHHSYTHGPVDDLLARLDNRGVPVILNSSKTFEEMLALRRSLHNRHPFVVENGSAVYVPREYFPLSPFTDSHLPVLREGDYWVLQLGLPRAEILNYMAEDAEQHGAPYLSFAKATTDEIMAATGLSEARAVSAEQRLYSEPLIWRGSETAKQAFITRATAAGFRCLQGGRFLHVLGPTDKGLAITQLTEEYHQQWQHPYRVLAAGDSPNDVDMLRVADIALIIRSPVRAPPELDHPQVIISEAVGPDGWNQVVSQLFV